MGFFDSFFQTPNPQAAAQAQTQGYQNAYNQLTPLLQQGRGALTTNYTAGLQPSIANTQQGQGGTQAYFDAVGANGQPAMNDAVGTFNRNPYFQSMQDLANQNIERTAASRGQLASGNTAIDLAQVAPQIYQQYVNNLQPALGFNTQNASNVLQGYGNLGTGLSNSFGTQGQAAYGTQAGIGNAQAGALNATGPGWGLIGGALNSFASAAGKGLTMG